MRVFKIVRPAGMKITEAGIRKGRGELPYVVTINGKTTGIHRTLDDAAQWLGELTGYPVTRIIGDAERRGYT